MNKGIFSGNKSILHTLFHIVTVFFYEISKFIIATGIVLLIFVLVFGEAKIEYGGILALGILMFFPLHYLVKRLNKR
jgi:hypothetical protein